VLQGLNPGWFFTGLEWIKLTAATEVAVRLLAAVAVIALVHDRGDGDKVLWIWTAGAGASLAVLTVRMYRVVPLRRPRIADGRRALRHGWALFVANASVSLYTTGTVFMLGLCVASAQLAMFSGAERLVRASLRATSQLAGATYPRVSFLVRSGREDRAHRLAVVALLGMFALASATAVAIIALAPWIVSLLLGPEFSAAVPLLRTLALLLPLVSLNTAFTGQWLMPRGFDGPVTRIVVVAAVANLVLTPAIAQIAGTGGVAWGLVALEAGMAGGMALVMWREGLIAVGNPHPTMQ
jgi:PST family polysaccharide transporter